jgi:hypothetical protein
VIRIEDLVHHDPGFDAAGNAVLIRRAMPEGFSEASPVDRLTYRRRVEAEAAQVAVAAAHAIMPSRPPGYGQMSAASRRAWWLKAEQESRGAKR